MTKILNNSLDYYIGHSTNFEERMKASSGGIGSAITRYLLSKTEFKTSITLFYDSKKCSYQPKLIFSPNEINVCGSVYQDIDIATFLRKNIEKVKSGIVLTCPPCQVSIIRKLLSEKKIPHFIMSFCCSGQTTIEGTWCYYRFIGIDKTQIVNMQYRGNGWPSGIQIKLRNGKTVFYKNYTNPWKLINQSLLFRPKRCLFCKRDTGYNADISLADPWLNEYKLNDKVGNTLFIVNTELGHLILNNLKEEKIISVIKSSYDEYAKAQSPNIHKDIFITSNIKYINILSNIIYINWYRKIVTSNIYTMKIHIKFMHLLNMYSICKLIKIINKKFQGSKRRVRSYFFSKKIAKKGKNINVQKGVKIINSKCVYIGNNVSIGENTFFGPVIKYAGIAYNPKIIIHDGTIIGKNCSFAAINRVEIGKNVLFAGHVHITDHSHGYEDLTRPITPQSLTSKGPVIIEDDCWLGFSCEILSGVHIGKHCIIGARAVVTKDVPDFSIVAGNPARVIKQFNFETKKWEKIKK